MYCVLQAERKKSESQELDQSFPFLSVFMVLKVHEGFIQSYFLGGNSHIFNTDSYTPVLSKQIQQG